MADCSLLRDQIWLPHSFISTMSNVYVNPINIYRYIYVHSFNDCLTLQLVLMPPSMSFSSCTMMSSPRPATISMNWQWVFSSQVERSLDTRDPNSTMWSKNSCSKAAILPGVMVQVESPYTERNLPVSTYGLESAKLEADNCDFRWESQSEAH